jgi:protein ImuB
VEDLATNQNVLWHTLLKGDNDISELLDRVAAKLGGDAIRRYLPDEHYWPERSIKLATSPNEKSTSAWKYDQRPIHLLSKPEPIEVSVPLPDYPPMLFIYKGTIHNVRRADGPERIEVEWWIDKSGLHRDYYCVEDQNGARYWLFRLGHYGKNEPKWFIHGFFA